MRQAVVLGASIAGLLSARVLADAYDRVLIIERDETEGAVPRRGVPQARHLHGLMERGRQIMEELFPGLTADCAAAGAPTTEVLRESRWYLSGLRVRPTDTGLTTLLASRPMLENAILTRTREMPGVELSRRAAAGLTGGRAITGVRLADGGEVAADLVVDATGRGSRAADWLAALGHERPAEERVDVDLGYSSRLYRRKPEHLDGDLAVVVSTMPGFRGGGAITLEGDRWHVTLAGMLGDHPPTDPAEFEQFAATLPVPDVHEIVRSAEPLDDPVPHRFRGSLRRRYDRISASPQGFLVVGDAMCSFNPLYAQGMTVAAQQALALRACLPAPDPARFYREAAGAVDVAWQMSTGSDLRYPGVEGPRSLRSRIVGAYSARAQVAAHHDAAVARTFMRTANLTIPPTSLLAPDIAFRVLRAGRR
ncbi:FAD-dependent oxidoreductase [Amycolatopsis acidicola]|uniref:FAD-dependent oxidoreductase n=1 Tax=Amycolatopsis acidicola TaxID=2596893 RepID=A0A5N0UR31_9PSEU|nr:FAD-dependent monooxygenase [Amycolatopsis acidicola]KAA9151246.1 FAD-dependent oxidoreductase [Amycolatopsis acidicola]